MVVSIKLFKNKLLNIMKNKYCILHEKKLLVENHGGHRFRNFAK